MGIERLDRDGSFHINGPYVTYDNHLKEIERLKAENETLKAQCQGNLDSASLWRNNCEELQGKIEKVQTDRKSLFDIASFFYMSKGDRQGYQANWVELCKIRRSL